jgi:uncharacterized CHY-type Zn-finger protein
MESPTPTVKGLDVTPRAQCSHWHSPRDIIAIRHKCCGQYYACISCHEALAGHPPQVWPRDEQRGAKAVLCGACRRELTVAEYLASGNACPGCRAEFNPGCALHYDLYFEM